MLRNLGSKILRRFLKISFSFWQTLGIHITRNHFYEPVPDTRTLDGSIWQNHSKLLGINVNEKVQFELLSHFKASFKKEYDRFPAEQTDIPYQYYSNNRFFSAVDGEILYCMIRHFRPRRIIEIGSGYSTYLAAEAVLNNDKYYDDCQCELITIDPYPNINIQKGFPGLSHVIPKPVQRTPLSEFTKLLENDMLLIDSSHVLKIGSDVQYEYLEILPRLNKGVIVSFHDIFIPAEYKKDWVLKHHFFWNEQYLLQAFLMFNNSFEILWMGSHMHLKHPEKLQEAFDSYNPPKNWPGSFWVRKKI